MKIEFTSANGGDPRSLGKLSAAGEEWVIDDAPDVGAFETIEGIAKNAGPASPEALAFLYAQYQGSMLWAEPVNATEEDARSFAAALAAKMEEALGRPDTTDESRGWRTLQYVRPIK